MADIGLDPNNGVDPEDPQFDYIHELVAGLTAPPPTNAPEG